MVHRVTRSDREWQQMVQRVTTNDYKWQQRMTSDNEWYEWQRVLQQVTTSGATSDRVTTSNTASDNEWQQIAMSNSEWQQWYNQWKRHSTLQRMDDCRPFNDKNRYTTTARDGLLQLEWSNKYVPQGLPRK